MIEKEDIGRGCFPIFSGAVGGLFSRLLMWESVVASMEKW